MTPDERDGICKTLKEIQETTGEWVRENGPISEVNDTKEYIEAKILFQSVCSLADILMKILPGATPGMSMEFPELGPIDTAFQIEGRGCVVEVDRSRWVIPPEVGEIRVDDALKIRTQAGQEILVMVSGFESSVYWTRRRFVLRGVSADQLASGDVIFWVGRLNPDKR